MTSVSDLAHFCFRNFDRFWHLLTVHVRILEQILATNCFISTAFRASAYTISFKITQDSPIGLI